MATPLVAAARVLDAWPGFNNLSSDTQTALIAGASRAVETECDRVLGSAEHSEIWHPGRSRKIYLNQYPVTEVTRVAGDLFQVLSVQNIDATCMRAAVKYTPTDAAPGDEAFTGITLTASGKSAVVLDFATYPTLQQLADAVDATAGWQATLASGYGPWACADLSFSIGSQGAKGNPPAYLEAFARDLDHDLDAATGELRLYESFPDNYRFPDRARRGLWLPGPRYGGVAVSYTAGYQTAYVPDDLQRIVASAAKYLYDMGKASGAYTSETIGGYSYTLAAVQAAATSGLPGWLANMCDQYRRKRIA